MQEKDQKKAFIFGGIAVAAWSTVATAFKICKLDKLIPLYKTEKKALSG